MRDFKQPFNIVLANESATQALASNFNKILSQAPVVFFLHGDLGAGKTCFARYLLQTLGVREKVKSPTYTVVESYVIGNQPIYHFDLYRVNDPSELEMLGMRDYLQDYAAICVEWAAKGAGYLPTPDVEITFQIVANERQATIQARTPKGVKVLQQSFNI